MDNEERRQSKLPRRRCDLNSEQRQNMLKLAERLRMQARTRTAANRRMLVEPQDPERTLEWAAAEQLEQLANQMV